MTPDDLLDESGALLLVPGLAQGDVATAQYLLPVVPMRNEQKDIGVGRLDGQRHIALRRITFRKPAHVGLRRYFQPARHLNPQPKKRSISSWP